MRRVNLTQEPPAEQDWTVLSPECVYPRFDLRSEVSHQSLNWPGCGVPKSTDSPTLDLFPVQRKPIDAER